MTFPSSCAALASSASNRLDSAASIRSSPVCSGSVGQVAMIAARCDSAASCAASVADAPLPIVSTPGGARARRTRIDAPPRRCSQLHRPPACYLTVMSDSASGKGWCSPLHSTMRTAPERTARRWTGAARAPSQAERAQRGGVGPHVDRRGRHRVRPGGGDGPAHGRRSMAATGDGAASGPSGRPGTPLPLSRPA